MLPAIYQSNFHPTAFFFIGKNERKTDMTLIGRMHSLGRGEGRVGWLSNGKYMHWLQDELGLGSRWEWKLCPWAAPLSETETAKDGSGRGMRCHWSSPYVTMSVCLQFVLWEACYQKKKKREREMKERDRDIERERETTTTTTSMDHKVFPETWCKVH